MRKSVENHGPRACPAARNYVGQLSFELSPHDVSRAGAPKHLRIQRSIESVAADDRLRVHSPDGSHVVEREPGSGMHRKMEADESGACNQLRVQALSREIQRRNVMTFGPEPRRRRGEPEWLPTKLVGCDQNDPQTNYYGALRRRVTPTDVSIRLINWS